MLKNDDLIDFNFRILILASAVFFYGSGSGSGGPASLFDAYDLLRDLVGQRKLPQVNCSIVS